MNQNDKVLKALLKLDDGTSEIRATDKQIAKLAFPKHKRGREEVSRALKQLTLKGTIKIERRGRVIRLSPRTP